MKEFDINDLIGNTTEFYKKVEEVENISIDFENPIGEELTSQVNISGQGQNLIQVTIRTEKELEIDLADGVIDSDSIPILDFSRLGFVVVGPSGSGKSTLIERMIKMDSHITQIKNFNTRSRRVSDNESQFQEVSILEYVNAINNRELFYSKFKYKLYKQSYFVGYRKDEINQVIKNNQFFGMTSHGSYASSIISAYRVPVIILNITDEEALQRMLVRDDLLDFTEYSSKIDALNKVKSSKNKFDEIRKIIFNNNVPVLELNSSILSIDESASMAREFIYNSSIK